MKKTITQALLGVTVGFLVIISAFLLTWWTEATGRTVGANIGASLLGLVGITIVGISSVVLIISILPRK